MIRNYLKVAWRNLKNHKLFSFINIFGLAIGLALFAIIAVIIGLDLNADRFHKNARRICGVIQVNVSGDKGETHSVYTSGALLPALRNEFPEIEDGTRVLPAQRMIVRQKDRVFYQEGILFADPSFLSIFSFPMAGGTEGNPLEQPAAAVISESTARKYFGRANPLGQKLLLNNRVQVTVTGVARELLEYSSIQFDLLLPRQIARDFYPALEDWNETKEATFLLLRRGAASRRLQSRLPLFLKKYYSDSPQSPKRFYLLPLLDSRLKSIVPVPITTFLIRSHPVDLVLNLSLAVILLLIACINFMNLAIARYTRRAKEIGLRKTIGARRWALIRQFIAESVVQAVLALPLALVIYGIGFPALARFVGLTQEFPVWDNPIMFACLVAVTILAGILSGLYPAFFLSSFNPVQVLKGNLSRGKEGTFFRRLLVITQFFLAIFLVMITLLGRNQHRHLLRADFGYDRGQVLAVSIAGMDTAAVQRLKNDMTKLPAVVSLSAAGGLPGSWNPEQSVVPEGTDQSQGRLVNAYGVDYGFVETVGVRMLQGRRFSTLFNDRDSIIINETMARQLGWDNALGRRILVGKQAKTVVGVANDFLFRRTIWKMGPALMFVEPIGLNWLLVKYRATSRSGEVRAAINQVWKRIVPGMPFEWTTLDDYFRNVYGSMYNTYQILKIIDGFMIFIACLGLFALASYMVERRTKEIGIRKVLGASVAEITRLVSWEYLVLVMLANALAIPLSAWVILRLLQISYAFSIAPLGIGMFIFTVALTLIAAFLAVASQVWRALRANPVDSLRYE
jgi:putative ABC transport system permease protein